MTIPNIQDLFDLSHTAAASYLASFIYPWQALPDLQGWIAAYGEQLPKDEYEQIGPHVWVAKSAKIMLSAYLGEYTVIGSNSEVRHGAFVRGSALIGQGCVVGNSTEIKNAILFDKVQVPHYNYVGDSILGYGAHMGAGSIASNFRSDKGQIVIHGQEDIPTGLKKCGAMLGDGVEIGCGAVLCPGSIVGKGSVVYPLSRVRGVIPAAHIYKGEGAPVPKR